MNIRVSVVRALPGGCETVALRLAAGACVGDAVAASGLPLEGIAGLAVFGQRVDRQARLNDGDRVELLRPLAIDPKEARRLRAASRGKRE